MYKEKIVDVKVGTEIIRDLTDEEILAMDKMRADYQHQLQNELIRANAKKAVLDKLGLTEEEAKALLG